MKIEINMINVEDGDAILIDLKKGRETAVILIDGGEKRFYQDRVKVRLKEVLKKYQKDGPDLVVCTHYDSDHIGGIIELVKEYGNKIGRLWIHEHPGDLKQQIELGEILSNKSFVNEELMDFEAFSTLKDLRNGMGKEDFDKDNFDFILESIRQLEKLYDLIDQVNKRAEEDRERKIIVEHPVRGHELQGWDCFKVEGPTKEYLEECFENFKDTREFLLLESQKEVQLLREIELKNILEARDKGEEFTPCKNLAHSSRITPTNKSSIICSLVHDHKKFLFTGDAGVESFKSIPNWKTNLKRIFWLDVPHHGSWNNTSEEMIAVFKPDFAFVSGDGGTNRPHKDLKACLEEKGSKVEITNSNKATWYLSIDQNGAIRRKLMND